MALTKRLRRLRSVSDGLCSRSQSASWWGGLVATKLKSQFFQRTFNTGRTSTSGSQRRPSVS